MQRLDAAAGSVSNPKIWLRRRLLIRSPLFAWDPRNFGLEGREGMESLTRMGGLEDFFLLFETEKRKKEARCS